MINIVNKVLEFSGQMNIKNVVNKIEVFFSTGHERSVKAKKNIIGLVITKGLGIIISLLLVRLTINYVNPSNYGIWLTLSSIVAWMSFFDIGVNNGMRNKLAASLALSDNETSQKLVSTTYAILSLIFIPLLLVLVFVNKFIYWPGILNTSSSMMHEIYLATLILFTYFCMRFILSTVNVILLANQRPAMASFSAVTEQIVSLLIIFILTKTTRGSLLNLAIGLCASPLFILLSYNIYFFRTQFRNIIPKISKIDFSLGKGLFTLGIKFFIISIAGIVTFQTANIILIRSFGPNEVTNYNICFKYFSILSMSMSILLTPLWSAVTDSYSKKEYQWIISTVKKYNKITVVFFSMGIIMLIFSDTAYKVWINNKGITIPFSLSLWMLIYTFSSVFGGVYCAVLNGIGALKVQFIASIFSPFIFLTMCYVLINIFELGVSAIVISIIASNINGYLLAPLQYKKIFLGKNKSLLV
jgi:O-antigen/teichoic acid export membrane protein